MASRGPVIAGRALVVVLTLAVPAGGCGGSANDPQGERSLAQATGICIGVDKRTEAGLRSGLSLTQLIRATAEERHRAIRQLGALAVSKDARPRFRRPIRSMSIRQATMEAFVVSSTMQDARATGRQILVLNDQLRVAKALARGLGIRHCPFL